MILDCLKESKEDHDINHHILGAKMDKCNEDITDACNVIIFNKSRLCAYHLLYVGWFHGV
jgi:hypothetical protein